MIKALKLFVILIGMFVLLCAESQQETYYQDNDGELSQQDIHRIFKIQSAADEAVGVMDKGQLQNITMNYGQISDTRYEDRGNAPTQYFYNFRYPRSDWTSLIDDFSILFATAENSLNGNNGNVIDGYTENDNEDWIAKDGSYGKTHYNPSSDPSPKAELLYPPTNPITPYLAHSDLQDTWPVDEDGDRFWPGYFRRDPATGEEFEGEFASDRDIYAVFTDANNQFGNPLGIEVEMMAYCYGRPYADKIHFYEFFIHNKSGGTLDSCYVGYYGDPDCSDYGEETFIVPDATFSDPAIPDVVMNRDFDGDINGASQPNNVGKTEDESFGIAIIETPKDIGVSTFHYFQDTGPVDDKVLWPIINSNPEDKDIVDFNSSYFHGTNRYYDDMNQLTIAQDLVYIVASGPFSMEPDEVVKSTIVVAVGDTDDDFYAQIDQAINMQELGFIGPSAPPAPTLNAIGISEQAQVTLYWDDISEKAADPFSGEIDFEGYRIFRSVDNGQTWGQEVRDARGSLIGYVPIAQFDLDNDISGNDPSNPVSYLGDNTGISHTYVDTDVQFGMAYSYTIVAFDRGNSSIYSLESSRGTATTDKNFITVTPLPQSLGKLPPEIDAFQHVVGNGKGIFDINIIDENALLEDQYKLLFNGTPASSFNLINMSKADTIGRYLPVNFDDNPVMEGLKISINSEGKIGGVKTITDGLGTDVFGHPNADSSWSVNIKEFTSSSLENRTGDYEIRFVESGDMAYSWGASNSTATFMTNIEVWDITEETVRKICFEVSDDNNNQQWDENETIFIVNADYPDPQTGEALPAVFPDDFPYQVTITNTFTDVDTIPPKTGDIVNIESFRSLTEIDEFTFDVKLSGLDWSQVDLSDIRVVPNPYIVGAAWEEVQNVNQVRFMFLPAECTITIYTVSGEKVKTIKHTTSTNDQDASEIFNLMNENRQALAFGLYVYVVKTPDGKKEHGKFAIIR